MLIEKFSAYQRFEEAELLPQAGSPFADVAVNELLQCNPLRRGECTTYHSCGMKRVDMMFGNLQKPVGNQVTVICI
jgi:hypothetical protein